MVSVATTLPVASTTATFTPVALLVFVAVVFASQLVLSALWLRPFRYGPAEWALRWLTNARRPGQRTAPVPPTNRGPQSSP